MGSSIINVRDFGANGSGFGEDTVAFQKALDEANRRGSQIPLYIPPGDYLCDTLSGWNGQPWFGAGPSTRVKTKPGKDWLQASAGVSTVNTQWGRGYIRDMKIIVDQSVDASAGFDRGGVGNCAIAFDLSDNALAGVAWGPYFWDFTNLWIEGDGLTMGGANKTGGIFSRRMTYGASFRLLYVWRVAYGYREDYPTVNTMSMPVANDHVHFQDCTFDGCGNGLRHVNGEFTTFENIQLLGCTQTSFYIDAVASLGRDRSYSAKISRIHLEGPGAGVPFSLTGDRHKGDSISLDMTAGGGSANFGCNLSGFDRLTVAPSGAGKLNLTGDGNDLAVIARTTADIVDTGRGNNVEYLKLTTYVTSSDFRIPKKGRSWTLGARDADAVMTGQVEHAFYNSGLDLLVTPPDMYLAAGLAAVTADPTAEFGSYYEGANPGGWYFDQVGYQQSMTVGTFLPLGRCRVYFLASSPDAPCTQAINVKLTDNTYLGGVSCALTTSWQLFYVDIDFSPYTGRNVRIAANSASPAGRTRVAGILFRPWMKDALIETSITFANGVKIMTGTGTPEGSITAPVGSAWHRSDAGSAALYVKETGSGNTGWVAK